MWATDPCTGVIIPCWLVVSSVFDSPKNIPGIYESVEKFMGEGLVLENLATNDKTTFYFDTFTHLTAEICEQNTKLVICQTHPLIGC